MKSDKKHIPLKMLLFYINGLSKNAEQIKSHLDQCEYCRKIKENLIRASKVNKPETPENIPKFTSQDIYSISEKIPNKLNPLFRYAAVLLICLLSGFLFLRFYKKSRKRPLASLYINKKVHIVQQDYSIIVPKESREATLTFKDADHLILDKGTVCLISKLTRNQKGIDKSFYLTKGRLLVIASNSPAHRKLLIQTAWFTCTVTGTVFLIDVGKNRVAVNKGHVRVTIKKQVLKTIQAGKALSIPKKGSPVFSNLTSLEKALFKRAGLSGPVFQVYTSKKKLKSKPVIESIHLKNGKILKGLIIKRTLDTVILKTGTKRISIPVHEIESIQIGK